MRSGEQDVQAGEAGALVCSDCGSGWVFCVRCPAKHGTYREQQCVGDCVQGLDCACVRPGPVKVPAHAQTPPEALGLATADELLIGGTVHASMGVGLIGETAGLDGEKPDGFVGSVDTMGSRSAKAAPLGVEVRAHSEQDGTERAAKRCRMTSGGLTASDFARGEMLDRFAEICVQRGIARLGAPMVTRHMRVASVCSGSEILSVLLRVPCNQNSHHIPSVVNAWTVVPGDE